MLAKCGIVVEGSVATAPGSVPPRRRFGVHSARSLGIWSGRWRDGPVVGWWADREGELLVSRVGGSLLMNCE